MESESDCRSCPENINDNSDQGWLGRAPTQDECEVVEWLSRKQLPDSILHVGVGNSLFHEKWGSRVHQGLTRDGGEAMMARSKGLEVIVCNKYSVLSYNHLLKGPFDCIIDVNIRSYACCDAHFLEYMDCMRRNLTDRGSLITNQRGLNYLKPTSVKALRTLCPCWTISTDGNIVVMRRKRNVLLHSLEWLSSFVRRQK
jgi:hypothetical protein